MPSTPRSKSFWAFKIEVSNSCRFSVVNYFDTFFFPIFFFKHFWNHVFLPVGWDHVFWGQIAPWRSARSKSLPQIIDSQATQNSLQRKGSAGNFYPKDAPKKEKGMFRKKQQRWQMWKSCLTAANQKDWWYEWWYLDLFIWMFVFIMLQVAKSIEVCRWGLPGRRLNSVVKAEQTRPLVWSVVQFSLGSSWL